MKGRAETQRCRRMSSIFRSQISYVVPNAARAIAGDKQLEICDLLRARNFEITCCWQGALLGRNVAQVTYVTGGCGDLYDSLIDRVIHPVELSLYSADAVN
jgi:hypothetical protein